MAYPVQTLADGRIKMSDGTIVVNNTNSVSATKPKINLFDFSTPINKSTGPVAPAPAIKSPMLPTTNIADKFTAGLQKPAPQVIQPKKESGFSLIPKASANEEGKISIDEFANKIKNKYPDYRDVDNKILAEKMISKYPEYKDVVNLTVSQSAQPKKEDPGFLGGMIEQAKGIGSKTLDLFQGGLERIGEGGEKLANANSFMDYAEGLSQGVAGTFQSALSPIGGLVGQGIEPIIGLTGIGYKSLVPDNIQKAISSGTSKGIKTATDWYNSQSEPVKQKLRTAGYLTEIGTEFLGAKPAKEVGKQLLKGGEKVLSKTGEFTGKQLVKKGEKILDKGIEQSKNVARENAKKYVSPILNQKEEIEAFGKGNLNIKQKLGGLITKKEYIPTKFDDEVIDAATPYIKSKDFNINRDSIKSGIDETNKSIYGRIIGLGKSKDRSINEFKKEIYSIKPIAGLTKENSQILDRVKSQFIKTLDGKGNIKTENILDLRKKFDEFINQEAPQIWDGKNTDLKKSLFQIRDKMNDIVNKDVGDNFVKDSLKKEYLLYNASGNLAERAIKEGAQGILVKAKNLVQQHPYLAIGTLTGSAGVAIPALLGIGGTALAGKALYDSIKSPAVKKQLGTYLTGLGKLLGQTSDNTKKTVIKEQIKNIEDTIKLLPAPSGKPLTHGPTGKPFRINSLETKYISPKGQISKDIGSFEDSKFLRQDKLLSKTELNKARKEKAKQTKLLNENTPDKIAEKVKNEIAKKKKLEEITKQKELEQLKERQKKLMEAKKQQQANKPKPLKK